MGGAGAETALVKAGQSARETSGSDRIVVGCAFGLAVAGAVIASIAWEISVVPYT
jgi:hypothetical protein